MWILRKKRKSDLGRKCGNAGSGLENKSQEVGTEKKKQRRRKCKVRLSLSKKNMAFQKNYMKIGVKKLSRAGMVPARTWRVHAVGMAPTERLKLRRQMATAAGKKRTSSLSLFMEAYGLEVEEELSTLGHSVLGRRSLDRKMAS